MPLKENEIARREVAEGRSRALILRREGMRARWRIAQLKSADDHSIECVFAATVLAINENSEREMLEEVFLPDRESVTVDDVSRHFQAALAAAAAGAVSKFAADALVAGEDQARTAVITALCAAAKPVAFASGVEILPPFEIAFESGSFQRMQLRAMQQALVEQQTRRRACQPETRGGVAEAIRSNPADRAGVGPGSNPPAGEPGRAGVDAENAAHGRRSPAGHAASHAMGGRRAAPG